MPVKEADPREISTENAMKPHGIHDGTEEGDRGDSGPERWLPDMDLNHDKQIQSLLCYRYTIGQPGAPSTVGNPR